MHRIHPLAAAFPEMSMPVYDRLKKDMAARGQRRPIALYEGAVWDGRARLRACSELGLQPKFRFPKPKDEPISYLLVRHDRYGEPHSPERMAALTTLRRFYDDDWVGSSKKQRTAWLRKARNEFRSVAPLRTEPCAVCQQHAEFGHAHHSVPLNVQFELGIENALHDFIWLCPTHHRHMHMMISVYMTDTWSGDFLDRIPDRALDHWHAVERIFQAAVDLFRSIGGMHQNGLGSDYPYYDYGWSR